MRVQSALDQPLRAEIELSGVQDSELRTLEVALASRDEFAKAGVSRADHLLQLKFEVARAADTRHVIQVSSKKAIKEPFLQFVIAAHWSGGRIVRAYTALLDPPLYGSDKPSAVSTPKVVTEEAQPKAAAAAPAAVETTAKPVKPITGGPVGAPGIPGFEPAAKEAMTVGAGGGRFAEYGPVEKGDTLWEIASQLNTGGTNVNIFQVLIALHRENPEAFIGGSIHRLKKGAILRLGNTEGIAAIKKKDASRFYQAQLDEWLAYKGKIAQDSAVTKFPDAKAGAKGELTADKASNGDVAAVKDKPADMAPEKADRKEAPKEVSAELRIVQSPAGAQSGKGAKVPEGVSGETLSLKNQVSTLEEALGSRERENRELRERVSLLETQIKNATRLVQIENQQLAQNQQAGQQQAGKEPAKAAPAAGAVSPAPDAGATAKSVDAAVAPTVSTTPSTAVEPKVAADLAAVSEPAKAAEPAKALEEVKKAEEPKPVGQPAKVAEAPAPALPARSAEKPAEKRVRVEAPAPAAPGFMDGIFGFLSDSVSGWTLGGLGALAAGIGGLMFYRRRRSLAEFQESVLMGGHGQTTTTASEPNQNTRTDTSFLSDFGLGGVNVQADEVDPLAEAEVYLAYGRDEQAEEVLRDAAGRNPNRLELKTKLLEIYKQRKDIKAFETLAEELYPASGKGDPDVWKKVAAMGRDLNPENPLFAMELPVDALERKDLFRAAMPDRPLPVKVPMPQVNKPALATTAAPSAVVPKAEFEMPTAVPAAAATDEITLATPPGDDLDMNFDAFDDAHKHADNDLLDLDWETPKRAAAASAPEKLEEFSLELPGLDDEETKPAPAKIAQTQSDKPQAGAIAGFDFEEFESPSGTPPLKPDTAWPTEFVSERLAPEKSTQPDEPKWALDAIPDSAQAPRAEAPVAATTPATGGDPLAWDEAATKLELARAYMDMGDKVGARSILDEVIKEGNPAQQGQAKTLVSQLSS